MFDLRKQAYTIQLTKAERDAMNDYEVRYHRNRSIFQDRSAPQLTILGGNKQFSNILVDPAAGTKDQVTGLLGSKKMSREYNV